MKTVVAAALGECVHVAGVTRFLRVAEAAGWRTVFLGPAVSVEKVIAAAIAEKADVVGISYRLTPETGEKLLAEFAEAADDLHAAGVRFAFGGTPPLANRARKLGFFQSVFEGGEKEDLIVDFLQNRSAAIVAPPVYPQTTIERIAWKQPFPLLRHHFGLPDVQATIDGIERIAESELIDVISLGIDQDAQENFFHPERQDKRRWGAGGVPVRSAEDYRALYQASRRGNQPLLRTYSGTDDFIRLAEMYTETIHNAWCAIPLFWFNRMDGRGPWDLEGSIQEHQKVMAWYGAHNIPVELNEPHHWGMRDAPDVVYVVSAFLAAYNARAFGVKDYIAQMMFNSPAGLTDSADLGKMLAILELIEPLASADFRIWKQTRTGLLSYPLDPDEARGHLAASIYLQMGLRPHIIHIVGHTEAHHAATADDVMEACKIASRAIENAVRGGPDLTADPRIQAYAAHLVNEARITLQAIRSLSGDGQDAFTDPAVLSAAVTRGIMDAPQLRSNPFGRGAVRTQIIEGASTAIDENGAPINEAERLAEFLV